MVKLHNRGGTRPNAGRKRIWDEPTRIMRLPASLADTIRMVASAPSNSMVIWWADQQDIERSMPFLRHVPEVLSLVCSKWGKSGQPGIWSNHRLLQFIEKPAEKPECCGILLSASTARQICYLPGIWQIIPKSWAEEDA